MVHLHLHSEYSLLDGICRLSELPDAALAAGQKALAITDHGNMYGAVEFFKACKAKGIKPIIGCEVYVSRTTRFDRSGKYSPCHLVLLCKDETGYKNLSKLVSKAFIEGFYSKPRVDFELLSEYHEGLVALSGCFKGEVSQNILENDFDAAKATAQKYRDLFGDGNYYLEVQNHGLEEQKILNPALRRISDELSIPLVATNDIHYIKKEDSEVQAVSLCIQTNTTLDNENRFKFDTNECYFKTEDEMRDALPDFEDAIANTEKIADMCNFEFEFGKYKLPAFDTGCELTPKEYLYKLCREGMERRKSAIENFDEDKYESRMLSELKTIEETGFIDYYLIVWDFVNYAKSHGIPVGPGRGSGVGSLCAYFLNITDVDPIKYELYFERFLTKERVSMPDFDIDFSDERRDEVIRYVAERYGKDRVSQIITFGTLAACAAVRDVGRAMGMPYAQVDEVAKAVRTGSRSSLVLALKNSPKLAQMYKDSREIKKLIDMAIRLEGLPRNASTHASGVLITPSPCEDFVPLAQNGDTVLTQYTMTGIAELGLLKIDFLGLRYLTIIDHAVKLINENKNPDFKAENIPLDDKKVFDLFSNGLTEGVFQFESSGIKRVLSLVCPKCVEDIISVVSLYRPGPMDSIPTFIENRKHPEKIKYLHPALEPILKTTNGCVIYQEQVMQIFRTLAGYSLGRADIVRRMMAKKQQEKMVRERKYFIYGDKNGEGGSVCSGTLANGISEEKSNEIFDALVTFSNYGFNKSHAAPYGILAYRTAYLKCYYPAEYMCSLLSNSFTDKMSEYIGDCTRLGIAVLMPDVNKSKNEFTVEDGNIRFGFCGVKSIGDGFAEKIVKERSLGDFTSFENFVKRMSEYDMTKKHLESLIKSGACDSFGKKRSALLMVYEMLMDRIADKNSRNISGQMDMFAEDEENSAMIEYPDTDELSDEIKLSMEKDMTGFYFSGRPLGSYTKHLAALDAMTPAQVKEIFSAENADVPEKATVTVAGTVVKRSEKRTKKGDKMCFAVIDDMYSSIEIIVFPKLFVKYDQSLIIGSKIAIKGDAENKDDEEVKVIANSIYELIPDSEFKEIKKNAPISENPKKNAGKLYLRVPSLGDSLTKRALALAGIFDGDTEVVIYCTDDKKYIASGIKTGLTDYVRKEFENLLGGENVVLK